MPSKLVRRYRRKKKRNPDGEGSSGGRNPTAIGEVVEYVLPGFGGFAASRLLTRVAAVQIEKRKPSWGKHAGALAAVGAFMSAWLLAHKVKQLRAYHLPIVIGAGLAAIQSLLQLYLPQFGWIVADASPELDASGSVAAMTAGSAQQLPTGLTAVNDDPANYVYNDAYNSGRMDQQQADADAGGVTDDDLDDLDLDQQTVGAY